MAKKTKIQGVISTMAPPSSQFSIIFSTIALLVFVIQTFRGKNTSETIDKLIFASSIVIGLTLLAISLGKKKFGNPPLIVSLSTILVIIIGIMGVEKHPTMDSKFLSTLWLGFGWPVLIFTFLIVPFIFSLFLGSYKYSISKWILRLLSFVILISTIPAILQGGASIIDPYHSEYVINELLAVASGNIPYVDFIPQYGQLYAWLIAPLAHILSANSLVTIGLYLMSFGTLTAIFIGVWIVYRALGSKSLSLSVLLVIPFTSLSQFPGRKEYAGTIYDLLSAVPGRILPGMLIGLLTINLLISQKRPLVLTATLGFLSGIGLWINQDFTFAAGLVATIAIVIFASTDKSRSYYFISYAVGVFSYPLALAITGRTVRFDSIGFFIIQYTSGYMAEPIQTPGPVLIVLPLIVAITCASVQPLIKQRFKKTMLPADQNRALVTASFFSSWSFIGFAYYLNRSYASGQMQILLLPLSVAMASFFYFIVLKSDGKLPWTAKTFFQAVTWNKKTLQQSVSYLGLALIMSLPMATIIAFPKPSLEIDRLTNAPKDHQWPFASTTDVISKIKVATQTIPLEKIGYVGNSGNYIELVTGVKSANLLNSPWDMPPAPVPLKVGCDYISKVNREYLIVDEVGKRVQELFSSKKLCDKFENSQSVPTISPYLLARNPG